LNKVLLPKGTGWSELNYEFDVYNRWGYRVFKNNQHFRRLGWRGTNDKHEPGSATYDPENVYAWRIAITDNQAVEHFLAGQVMLLK
jgi:hypothetical protein